MPNDTAKSIEQALPPNHDFVQITAAELKDYNRAMQYSCIAAFAIVGSAVCLLFVRSMSLINNEGPIWLGLAIFCYLIAIFARWGSLLLWQRTTISAPAQLWFRWALGSYSIAFVCSLVAMILSFQQWQVPEQLISTLIVCDIACSYFALVFQNIGWHYWASRLGDKATKKLSIYGVAALTIFIIAWVTISNLLPKTWTEICLACEWLIIQSLLSYCVIYAVQLFALSCLIDKLVIIPQHKLPANQSPFVD